MQTTATQRRTLLPTAIRWHRRLAWMAGIAAILWALTGMTHPLMVWTMPQPATRFVPPVPLDLTGALPPAEVLGRAGLTQAAEVRATAALGRPLYAARPDGAGERRWFDPMTGEEVAGEDRRRAEALARLYAGEATAPVRDLRLVTAFDAEYPAVNALLPVWRVVFDRQDSLTAFVDTGGERLGTLTDDRKRVIQWIFRNIHTLAFLEGRTEPLRVLLITLLVGSVLATVLAGVVQLLRLRRPKRPPGLRGLHRIGGWVVAVPALMLTISGLWQLLHSAIPADQPRLPPQRIATADLTAPLGSTWAALTEGRKVTGLAVVVAEGTPLLRLELPPPRPGQPPAADAAPAPAAPAPAPADPHAHHGHGSGHEGGHEGHGATTAAPGPGAAAPDRTAFFRGQPQSGAAILADGATGQALDLTDSGLALRLASTALGRPLPADTPVTLVTRFSDEYGFLNKRLPVWRILPAGEDGPRLFIDTEEAVVAAHVTGADLLRDQVFDLLHKWRFLDGLGQVPRDIILMVFAALLAGAGTVGILLRRR
ncbi:MAG: hypothetical protein RLY86_399 [Pseudomonadota bacterium]|jgi:hypothetical protein